MNKIKQQPTGDVILKRRKMISLPVSSAEGADTHLHTPGFLPGRDTFRDLQRDSESNKKNKW